MIYVKVRRDDKFWQNKMKPFFLRFYKECLVPEIIDSRHNRNMPIREPEYILKAKEEKKKRDDEKKADKLKEKLDDSSEKTKVHTKRKCY